LAVKGEFALQKKDCVSIVNERIYPISSPEKIIFTQEIS
jgi:hypothetical protein